jgi:hypothetical protein
MPPSLPLKEGGEGIFNFNMKKQVKKVVTLRVG